MNHKPNSSPPMMESQDQVKQGNGQPDGRNLAFEFEKLYVSEKLSSTPTSSTAEKQGNGQSKTTPVEKDTKKNVISPTCVIEEATLIEREQQSGAAQSKQEQQYFNPEKITLPEFYLHPDLKRELTQPQLNRISVYSVIHDINKDAGGMAANDHYPVSENSSISSFDVTSAASSAAAIIDEERWLLAVIKSRSAEESRYRPCPAGFVESIGEEERALSKEKSNADEEEKQQLSGTTPNPLIVLESSRTQLWKPSRSWWEARSGKNPWIEPKSHNKRWRYLWPLIHYHKFLARCVKKLKRNRIDVKTSYSPVSVFLREEVCAVSEHLGSVSKFTAEEWLSALSHFEGWTNADVHHEQSLRILISQLTLKSIGEPNDVDSPLLRDQIDEQFLRAMAQARSQMHHGGGGEGGPMKERGRHQQYGYPSQRLSTVSEPENHHLHMGNNVSNIYPHRMAGGTETLKAYKGGHRTGNKPHNEAYYGNPIPGSPMDPAASPLPVEGYHPPVTAAENCIPEHFSQDFYYHQHPHYPSHYFPAPPPMQQQNNAYFFRDAPPNAFPVDNFVLQQQPQPSDWNPSDVPYYPFNPASPHHGQPSPEQQAAASSVPPSPYWGHLDPLAMTGLASPPNNGSDLERYNQDNSNRKQQRPPKNSNSRAYGTNPAKPLLIHPSGPYYPRPNGGGGYAPPSPATQFYNTLSPYYCGVDPRSSPYHIHHNSNVPPKPSAVDLATEQQIHTPQRSNKLSDGTAPTTTIETSILEDEAS